MDKNTETLNNIDNNSEHSLLESRNTTNAVKEIDKSLEHVLLETSKIEENTRPKSVQKIELVNTSKNELATAFYGMLRGPIGKTGDTGKQGEKGDTGADSQVQGPIGETGEVGQQGERGEQGYQGIQGLNGEKGQQGDAGVAGKDGIDGKDGKKGDKGKDVDKEIIKEIQDKVDFVVQRSSKTVSLVELDDVNLTGLTQTAGKYNLGSGGGGTTPTGTGFTHITAGAQDAAAKLVDTVDINTNVVTNAKLAQMAANTIKGNNTGATANASDLTVAQVNAILPVFTSTLNGLVPLSGGGTTNFLRADGTFAVPPSGSGGIVRSISSISTPTTAGATASTDYVYLVSGATTLTLPTAIGNTNRYTVKNVGSGAVTVATTAAQTIDGGSTAVLTASLQGSIDLISDNSNWNIT